MHLGMNLLVRNLLCFVFHVQSFPFVISLTCVEGLLFSLILYVFVYTVLCNTLGLELLR